MSQTYPAAEQALLGRIVEQPAFRRLLQLPLIAWQEIAVLSLCYAAVIGGAALYLNDMAPYPLVLLVSGVAIYAVFTPLHDATHRSVSRNAWVNDGIGTLAAQLMVPGATTPLYRYLHLEHHRHTGDPAKDPDEFLPSAGLLGRLLLAPVVELKWLLWYLDNRDNRSAAQHRTDLISVVFYVGWHVAWLASPWAWEFFLLWMLPQRLGLGIVATLFATIQHPEGVRQSERPLQATRMFFGGPMVRLAMLSQSQHLMHHMFPAVPFYRYNQAWKLSEPEMRDQPLVWSPIVGRLVEPEPVAAPQLLDVTIEKVVQITDDIRAYTFAAADGAALPAFEPGAHIDVHIAPGLIRQYSLTGLVDASRYSIAVKCEAEGRGGSRTLHEQFAEGQQIQISHPRNLFALQPQEEHAVLLAGGIGITPILSMALALQTRGNAFEFHVCARDADMLPFADVLQAMGKLSKVQTWLDTDGGFTADALPTYQAGHNLYLCGPDGFMNYIRGLAAQQGWPESAIHSEAFAAAADTDDNQAFTVELARSGKTIEVSADESLLDALQANEVSITASCEQGICATCQCKVLKGDIDHRDRVLTDDQHAAGMMTACVSRAKGDQPLVLDL